MYKKPKELIKNFEFSTENNTERSELTKLTIKISEVRSYLVLIISNNKNFIEIFRNFLIKLIYK